MAISRQSPRVFNTTSTGLVVTASSAWNFQLGFRPKVLQIENLGSVPLYVTFGTTSPATTSGLMISSCSPGNVFGPIQLGLENGSPAIGMDMFSVGATATAGGSVNAWALG